jgi:putative DNA primase/helicase
LFRGYVKTKNKQCVEPFKGRADLKTLEQVQSFSEYAGILEEETVLIDVDDVATSEILFRIVKDAGLKCRVYKTARGKHFLFKNAGMTGNKTKCKLAICLEADIKLGCKNSYSILKFDGVEREILYDAPEADIQDVPKWLFPVRTNADFLDMDAGDGRNQSLFNYILTLQSSDFTVDEARETIGIINDYVLKTPLRERELETVLRDDAFKKPVFFKGTSFLFDKFAIYVKNNDHIIKINGQLHIYKNGVYVSNPDEIEAAMIKHIENLNQTKRKEVLRYLNLLIRDSVQETDAKHLAFKNGVLNVADESFHPYTPDLVLKNIIPWDYNPSAESDIVDAVMTKISCGDDEIKALLEECAGYCFFRKNELGKAFILTGDGENGKSTYIDMIKTMLGDDNITSIDLKDLGEKFQNAEIFGKLANLGDDIGDEFIASSSVFKKLVTGERIQVQRKGQDPFEFNSYSKMIFSANDMPRIRDKSGGLRRRLTIIPFDAVFSKTDPDYRPFIKYELREREAVERLILLAVKGLRRVLENNAFTAPKKTLDALAEYEKTNNSIIAFVEEYGIENFENNETKDVYNAYGAFCAENGLREAYSNITFSVYVKKHYGLDVIDKKIMGKRRRIFAGRKDG